MAVGTGSNPNRQRMINLMYIVFIAMMALNVSPEVLDGFSKVEGELRQATEASEAQNGRLASDMQAAFSTNPAKASVYYEQSQELQRRTDSLYQHLQQLKEAIAIEADGRGASPDSLQHRDNLSAASIVLLAPIHPKGKELRKHLNSYISWVRILLKSSNSEGKILSRLSTPEGREGKTWEEECFESMPAIAAITQLTQLQNSLRYVEGETLSELLHIEAELNDGTIVRSPFESSYTVIEPTATIAPTMMNVLYAGIDNPIQIAVPGIPLQDITATSSSGSLIRKGDLWIAHPTKAGSEVIISVTANVGGKSQPIAQTKLRVRSLPDPMPYLSISIGSGSTRFKGGRIAKNSLLASGGVRAALDDSFLDINYSVLRFQLLAFDALGNALPESSQGANFSDRQIRLIQNTPHGRRLFITDIIARGPDGVERRLPSLELVIA